MNYQTLFQTIQAYCENDFPDTVVVNTSAANVDFLSKSQIDTFIQQAEQRIYNSVQLPATRYNVTGQCTTGNKYLSTPLDWLSTFSLSVIHPVTNEQTYLLNKDVEFIRSCYPDPDTEDTPEYYAIFDNTTFILGPTPDADYFFELHYFAYPQSIVTTGTSWLGNNFDSALLYGSLLEAYTFMKGEQDVQTTYKTRYDEAMTLLLQLVGGKNRQDMYRTQQARYPVK